MSWTARGVGGSLDGQIVTRDDSDLDRYGQIVVDPGGWVNVDLNRMDRSERPRRVERYDRRPNPDSDTDYLLVLT